MPRSKHGRKASLLRRTHLPRVYYSTEDWARSNGCRIYREKRSDVYFGQKITRSQSRGWGFELDCDGEVRESFIFSFWSFDKIGETSGGGGIRIVLIFKARPLRRARVQSMQFIRFIIYVSIMSGLNDQRRGGGESARGIIIFLAFYFERTSLS